MEPKIYYQAIRALPELWVHNETQIARLPNDNFVAANPNFAPLLFDGEKWAEISSLVMSSVDLK
jgi:hypothetical protein